MKDKRYGIQKVFGGADHKKHQVLFNGKVLDVVPSRYDAEQFIVQHKKARVSETV